MTVEGIDPATTEWRTSRWGRLRQAAVMLAPAAAGACLAVMSPRLTALLAALVVATAVAVWRVLARPRRVSAWLYELAEVPPALTHLIRTLRTERRKWRRAPPRPDRGNDRRGATATMEDIRKMLRNGF